MKVDKYILEKCIAKGVFGDIYLARVEGDSKQYVAKLYDREKADIPGAGIKDFLNNETYNVFHYLDHPNIVKIIDLKKTKNHYYIFMEYYNGGKLSKALEQYIAKNKKPFPEKIIQHFMRQIIDAINYIHGKDIIYKYPTIDNMLLHYENEEDKNNFNLIKAKIKIVDFSYSMKLSKIIWDSIDIGTPFLPPHPLVLKKLIQLPLFQRRKFYMNINTKYNDIESIGNICYEMLIGKPAFSADNNAELLKAIENGDLIIPTTMSYEIVSFLNGMIQLNTSNKITASQLLKHDFLNKDIKQFKMINLEINQEKSCSNVTDTNTVNKSNFWSIYNKKSEALLNSILGTTFIEPKDKEEELEFEKQNEK